MKGKLIPNVIIVLALMLVNPATSATPERTFSLRRSVVTWERPSMTQLRSNSLVNIELLHECDEIDLLEIGNEFISKFNERKFTFGSFVTSDFT